LWTSAFSSSRGGGGIPFHSGQLFNDSSGHQSFIIGIRQLLFQLLETVEAELNFGKYSLVILIYGY